MSVVELTHPFMTSRTIKRTFSIKVKSYFKFLSGFKTALDVNRYLFGILSTCENVRENFEEI